MSAKNDAIAALLDLEDTLNFAASREVVEATRKGFTVTQKAIEALAAENAWLRRGHLVKIEKITIYKEGGGPGKLALTREQHREAARQLMAGVAIIDDGE